jgi:FkbM family methyltransferase
MTDRMPTEGCWPATFRDWLTAHSCVRLGRLDRFSTFRSNREKIVRILARGHSSIRFDTGYGFEIFLPASDCGMIMMALRGVLFHSSLAEIARGAIRPGDIVIDGGSNVGFFALLAATKLHGSGTVFAFEPAPDTFSLLQQNIRHNGFEGAIRAERLALTDGEGVFDFSVDSDESTLSSLVPRKTNSLSVVRVQGIRLDSFLAESGLQRADIIKLDLEGAEPMALEGAREVLPTARMLIFEANEPQLEQLGVDPVALVERAVKAGNFDTVSFIDERSEKIRPWDPRDFEEALKSYKFINVLCARSNSFESQESISLRSTVPSSASETSRQ